MRRDTIIQLGAASVLVTALGLSVLCSNLVSASIGRYGLVYSDRALEGDPPEVGLGIAMGAFRGIFVNFLWLRANQAKEEGRYYEAVDLAKTITRLQPRFPRVWSFHAWNLAYNISVATQTQTERWNWVNAGIRLLRNEGIPANPNDLLIHRELCWLFLHKVQGIMDDANQYYKRMLAEEWTIVLGPPRRPKAAATRQDNMQAWVDFLRRVSSAKDTMADVLAADPAAPELVARLTATGLDLATTDGRMGLLRTVETARSLGRLQGEIKGVSFDIEGPIGEMLLDPKYQSAWGHLVPHLRKRLLLDEYKMEPERMIRYVERFGPLDWRHPAAHALYWAQRGVDEAMSRVTDANRADFDFLNTDRLTAHAVQELYRSGSITFDILKPRYYLVVPNADFIPAYRKILSDLVDREVIQMRAKWGVEDIRNRPFNLYAAGYENFMKDAIIYLYRRGQKVEAAEFKTQLLADWKAGKLNKHDYEAEYLLSLPMDEFIQENLKERLSTPSIAVQEVYGALQNAYISGLLAGDQDVFKTEFAYARSFHAQYIAQQLNQTNVDPENARLELFSRDFAEVAAQMFAVIIGSVGVDEGAIMYNRAPNDLRLYSYDFLSAQIEKDINTQAESTGLPKFAALFPPPEGLEAYRAAKAAARPKPRMGETEQK